MHSEWFSNKTPTASDSVWWYTAPLSGATVPRYSNHADTQFQKAGGKKKKRAISDSSIASSATLCDGARGTACIFTCHDKLHQFQSLKTELLVQRATKHYQLLYATDIR